MAKARVGKDMSKITGWAIFALFMMGEALILGFIGDKVLKALAYVTLKLAGWL